MTPIRDTDELAAALSEPRAIIFLWVNWAIQSVGSHRIVESMMQAWESQHPDEPVPFYVVDVSTQSGELWDALANWLTAEGCPTGQLLMSGVGPLLWLQSGQVVMHVAAPLNFEITKLVSVTRSVFATISQSD